MPVLSRQSADGAMTDNLRRAKEEGTNYVMYGRRRARSVA
jgi:hypothetical protein